MEGDFLECRFELPEPLLGIVDGTEVEIHGVENGDQVGALCCRWKVAYVRELVINGLQSRTRKKRRTRTGLRR